MSYNNDSVLWRSHPVWERNCQGRNSSLFRILFIHNYAVKFIKRKLWLSIRISFNQILSVRIKHGILKRKFQQYTKRMSMLLSRPGIYKEFAVLWHALHINYSSNFCPRPLTSHHFIMKDIVTSQDVSSIKFQFSTKNRNHELLTYLLSACNTQKSDFIIFWILF